MSPAVVTAPVEDAVDEARRLLALAEARGVPVRALGGAAIRLSVPTGVPLLLAREYQDIDLIIPKREQQALGALMATAGYSSDDGFNAVNGHRRLLYHDPAHSRQVDVFVATFAMCHEIPLSARLLATEATIPLPELLLTKLQIVELNPKDVGDILNLVYHHCPNADGDPLDVARVAACCAADWGLWRTAGINIARADAALDELSLTGEERRVLHDRLEVLRAALEDEPKSRRWKLRARIGDRVQWYEEPEEVA